jgi:hypothetical protein
VDPNADLAQGGSNKGSVSANVSNAANETSKNKAVKVFHSRMCYTLDLSKKIQESIGDADKGKKLDAGILTNICKKMNEQVSKE